MSELWGPLRPGYRKACRTHPYCCWWAEAGAGASHRIASQQPLEQLS